MGELLHVSSSPHIRSKVTRDYLMKMVIVALMPATVAGTAAGLSVSGNLCGDRGNL